MNRRQRKKRDKEAIAIAKKILYSARGNETYWDVRSYTKYIDAKNNKSVMMEYPKEEQREKEILLKVIRKCLKDSFSIEEYFLWEIPYKDKEGWIMDFVHIVDFKNYHEKGNHNIEIREIDFWCPFNSRLAIPQRLVGGNLHDRGTCQEAVYVE